MSYRLIFSGIAVSVLITPFISGNLGMAGGIILLGLTAFVSYLLPPRMSLNVDGRGHPMLCGALCTSGGWRAPKPKSPLGRK